MEQIILFVLFLMPGFLVRIYKDFINPSKQTPPSTNEELTAASLFSMAVLFVNTCIINNVSAEKISVFSDYSYRFQSLSFSIKYFILSLATSFLVFLFWDYCAKKMVIWAYNTIFRSGMAKKTIEPSSYDRFIQSLKKNNNVIVSISKDGNVIAQGRISHFGEPDNVHQELLLDYCHQIKEVFETDADKHHSEQMFPEVVQEYINLETGISIKQYNSSKYYNSSISNNT